MSNKVSITDLLTAVGSDNIRFQDVMSSMENIKISKGTTIISFATDAMSPGEAVTGSGPKGLVLWIDQSLMQQRLNELNEGEVLTYGRLLAQRDALLAELEGVHRIASGSNMTHNMMVIRDHCADAIAKAKGGAA